MIENEWRDEYCPESEHVYCDCPFEVTEPECEGAWDCNDIQNITVEFLDYYDTNSDNAINPEDEIDAEHYSVLVEYCDFNNDGSIDACEVHDCIVMCENEWRDEYCPDYGHVACDCPFGVVDCEGAWYCDDIDSITLELMSYYDTNGDGSISLEDDIDPAHLDEINQYCDYDGSGSTD